MTRKHVLVVDGGNDGINFKYDVSRVFPTTVLATPRHTASCYTVNEVQKKENLYGTEESEM